MKVTYQFAVSIAVDVDEDFTVQDAQSPGEKRSMERALFNYLQGWRMYPKSADVECMAVVVPDDNPRERGDDDGVEYADPRDYRDGRE